MKKIIYIITLFFICILPVKADEIYNINMNINIQKDGSANITEIWNVKADSGTEWYKQVYNLGNSDLDNFVVYMDGDKLTQKSWNINESLSQKAGYYGINETSSCLELCFGKKDFKQHKFTLNYTLSNFIFNTSDSQVLYFTLLPNVTLDNFSVVVSSYYEFPDTLDVWGYGYKGYAYVENGQIKMSNEGSLNDDYVVLLVKFPLSTFETTNTYSEYNTFNDVYNKSEEGTYEYNYNNKVSFFDKVLNVISTLIFILFPL